MCSHCVARVGCCEKPHNFAKLWRVASLIGVKITDGLYIEAVDGFVIPVYNNWSDLNFVVEATGG